jgi:KaiC/GvpD/RAD55 family RecA-like ATPase
MDKFPVGCSKKITIVEGDHFDTPSAFQMLNTGSYLNPVISIPSAKPTGKLWENCQKYLNSFEEIILAVDNDEAGRQVASEMFDLFGPKLYTVNFGDLKDANDFLEEGKGKAFVDAWWRKTKFSPAGFTAGAESWLKALEEENPYTYTPTPISEFNVRARGLVKGGITILKALPGSGKSSLLRMFMHDLVANRGVPVAALMMEEMKSITARAMATQALGANVMTKEDAVNNGISEEKVAEAVMGMVEGDKFVSFEVNPQDPIHDTLEKCKQAVLFYGVEYIFIDHLQRLAYLAGTDTATANLTELGVKLTEFAKRKDIGIVCISHVNEDKRTKYAASIEEEAIVVIELDRDRNAKDLDEQNTSYLVAQKNRPFGSTGPAGALTYDPETTILKEKTGPQEPQVQGNTTTNDKGETQEIPF